MAEWTEGPWENDDVDLFRVNCSGRGEHVATTQFATEKTDRERLANSILIAAAPDLYAALEGLLVRVADEEEYGPGHAVTIARAALSRARGGAA